MDGANMKIIAKIKSPFPTKFGIPRQSGLTPELKSQIIFEPEYRNPDAFRGLEGFSHLWLIWEFSENIREGWSPTVRPPRLGGNVRMGVFATRSPFRPNPIGLSSVKIESIELNTPNGPVITVTGADLMDGTPIYDIKPYITISDCHTDASDGFAKYTAKEALTVNFPGDILNTVPEDLRASLITVLENDPRPHYQNDPNRVYGFGFSDFEVKFKVNDNILTVIDVEKVTKQKGN